MPAGSDEIRATAGMDVGVFILVEVIWVIRKALGDFMNHLTVIPLIAQEERKRFFHMRS